MLMTNMTAVGLSWSPERISSLSAVLIGLGLLENR